MVSEAEIQENHEKNDSKNHAFFACVFKFWEGFGTSLASLGALLSVFFQGFVAKRTQEGPRGGQEASWARFSMVLDRFGEGFGRPK